MLRKLIRNQKGFTLVELLVVVAILGTLAGVVALNMANFADRGYEEACLTERDIVQAAVVAYMADNDGAVPALATLTTTNYLMDTPKYIVGGDIDASSGAVTHDCTPP
jgi:type IV pilus assembly protein PilA